MDMVIVVLQRKLTLIHEILRLVGRTKLKRTIPLQNVDIPHAVIYKEHTIGHNMKQNMTKVK